MTIDEAIKKHKKLKIRAEETNDKRGVFYSAEEHEQIAEWLEELKAYREIGTVEECKNSVLNIPKAYNKAIDDFVKFANTMPTVETEDGEIRPMRLEEMAEQLKEGREDENSN